MIAFSFEYHTPATLSEALELLSKEGYVPVLGGTDLVVKMRAQRVKPKGVVDLKKIAELHDVNYDGEKLVVGAAVTLNELIEEYEMVKEHFNVLYQGMKVVGAYQTRNRATLAGNIANSSPAADTVPALLTYDTELRLLSKHGERVVPLKDFFTGPGKNILRPGEIIHSVIVPDPGPHVGKYCKLSRVKVVDLSTIGVAVTVIDPEGARDIRVALASVSPTPLRVFEAEQFIKGKKLTEENVSKFAKMIADATSPITDARGSAEYRKKMAEVLPKRILRDMSRILCLEMEISNIKHLGNFILRSSNHSDGIFPLSRLQTFVREKDIYLSNFNRLKESANTSSSSLYHAIKAFNGISSIDVFSHILRIF